MKIKYFGVICLLTLAACASPDSAGMPLAQMTFAEIQALPINVASINVQGGGGHKPDDFAIDPDTAAHRYLAQRFKAVGGAGSLRATIEASSVTKTHQAADKSIASYLNVAGTDDYEVTLAIRFEHLDAGGNLVYGKLLTAHRSLHVGEHVSIAKREQAEQDSMEELFHDLDPEIRLLVLQEMHLGG